MSPVLALLALFMLAKPSKEVAATAAPAAATAGPRVVGRVLMIPLRDGSQAIVAQMPGVGNAFDAIVIARGTVYGSRKGEAVVLRCGSEEDAKAIAAEIGSRIT